MEERIGLVDIGSNTIRLVILTLIKNQELMNCSTLRRLLTLSISH